MGGEWASGAALVSETWKARDRGKALGLMQSSWALGYGLAAIVNYLVQDVSDSTGDRCSSSASCRRCSRSGCGGVCRAGGLAEPRTRTVRVSLGGAGRARLGITAAVTLMNACTMFGWWGFNLWVPSYLQSPASACPARG